MINPISPNANCNTQKLTKVADLTKINLKASVRVHGEIARHPWAKLWYLCRAIDTEGKGYVIISLPEFEILMGRSRATFYRWLKDGKEAGAFRSYEKEGEHFEKIYLGSKTEICKRLKITDWDSVTYTPLYKILKPLKKNPHNEPDLREQVTAFQTQWLEERSKVAARKEARINKDKRLPHKPDFRGATVKPSSPILPSKFSRKNLPVGASQETIAKSLGISSRSVRRHLKQVERQQVYYKVPKCEAQAEIFHAGEAGKKCPIFERKGEYFKYGPNLYNLNFTQKSEWIQRLKYKFNLLVKNAEPPDKDHKKNLYNCFELDTLDLIIVNYLRWSGSRSFGKLLKSIYREISAWNRAQRLGRRTM